jgi:DNA-binding transcriptional MocR family regulator
MEDHIRQVLVPTYKARCAIVQRAIEKYLGPLGVNIDIGRPYSLPVGNDTEQVMGGFFIYITFPEGIAADDVAAVALKEYNLRFLASGDMRVRGSKGRSNEALLSRGARLCWAWEEESMIIEGVKRIASVLKEKFSLA